MTGDDPGYRCGTCRYSGPEFQQCDSAKVECRRNHPGSGERKIIRAWNGHIKPLSTIPTPDLVQELCSREGVGVKHVIGWVDFSQPEKYEVRVYREHGCMESSGKYDGPATIIVVRGDE